MIVQTDKIPSFGKVFFFDERIYGMMKKRNKSVQDTLFFVKKQVRLIINYG